MKCNENNMLWFVAKCLALVFVPIPVNPKITRLSAQRYIWTFACDEFKTPYQLMMLHYYSPHVA